MEENVNPQNNNAQDKASGVELRQLRTYEDDVKNIIGNQNVSTSDMMLAEQKKRFKQQTVKPNVVQVEKPKKTLNLKPVITGLASILLFAGGAFAIYFTYNHIMGNNIGINFAVVNNDLIDIDETVTIDSRNKTLREIVGEIRNIISAQEVGDGGELIELKVIKDVVRDVDGVEKVAKEQLISEDFFTLIESDAPQPLLRSLNDTLIIGLHKRFKMEPFVILQTQDLDQTYSGMLDWERTMVREIRDIFFENLGSSQLFTPIITADVSTTTDDVVATSTEVATSTAQATSTPEVVIPEPSYVDVPFRDLVISNKDARGLVDEDGEIIFFYSIVDNQNLIITTNRETLDLVLNRISVAKLIR